MFQDSIGTLSRSLIFSSDIVVPFLLIIKQVIHDPTILNLRINTIGKQINIFAKSLNIRIITSYDDSSMIIIFIHFNESFNPMLSILTYNWRLIDDPRQLARCTLTLDLHTHVFVLYLFNSANVGERFEYACFSLVSGE